MRVSHFRRHTEGYTGLEEECIPLVQDKLFNLGNASENCERVNCNQVWQRNVCAWAHSVCQRDTVFPCWFSLVFVPFDHNWRFTQYPGFRERSYRPNLCLDGSLPIICCRIQRFVVNSPIGQCLQTDCSCQTWCWTIGLSWEIPGRQS